MDVSKLDFNKLQGFVSPARLKKADKYFHQKDKQLSLGVEILLNHALGEMGIYDPIFGVDKYGKPYLKNYSDIYFNLSHSESYVACAVSNSPVGVDIEYIDEVDLNVAERYFFGSEYEYILNNSNKKEAFFSLWVLKESYMKMTGLGFHLPLDEFSIEIDDEIKLIHKDNTVKLGLWNVCGGEYMLGICSKNKITEPILINLDDIENVNHEKIGETA